ncbi:MAG: DUF1549 domain-containing protein, partial [Candidatus Acidiferrum sp.]
NSRWPILLAIAALFFSGGVKAGDVYPDKNAAKLPPPALPKPAEIQAIAVYPMSITLHGGDDAPQLLLSATLVGDRPVDLTTDAIYEVADAKVARVTSTGRVVPLANGLTSVTASFAGKIVQVPVKAEECDVNLPINFPNQIVPIFTKLGCNSGGCHGKASGQNGFKISLLGFEPEVDFTALVKESRGRRLFPSAPEHSLLLEKAAGIIAHGGGKRMEVGSDEYRLIRRWIAAGSPYGSKTDPIVKSISVYPDHRVMARNAKQQFAAYAHYSDGTVEDITRRAQYESNDQEIAVVDGSGLVRTLAMSGEAAIMVRYQEFVSVFRATVPLGDAAPNYEFPSQTLVDQFTRRKWQELGLAPSELCADEPFIRRVSLDLTGTLPTPGQVLAFVADKDARKRDKLIDKLLDSPEYSWLFSNKWADILRVKRRGDQARARGTFAFHDWIRNAVATDMPYDEFARSILAATGDELSSPPTVWYKELHNPEQFVDDTAQVFLGLRLACAQCHHHPYEKWSQDDFWGIAAFFGRVGRKGVMAPDELQPGQAPTRQIIYARSSGAVTNK